MRGCETPALLAMARIGMPASRAARIASRHSTSASARRLRARLTRALTASTYSESRIVSRVSSA